MKYQQHFKLCILCLALLTASCAGDSKADAPDKNTRITLSLSYKNNITALAGYPTDIHFRQALDSAAQQAGNAATLLSSFLKIYNAAHPAKPLRSFFNALDAATDEALQASLQNILDQKTEALKEALRKRAKILYNIDPQKIKIGDNNDELLLELPAVTDSGDLKFLFANRQGMQMWALTNALRMMPFMVNLNERYKQENTAKQTTQQNSGEQSLQQLTDKAASAPTLLDLLHPSVDPETGQPLEVPFIGVANITDTARVSKILLSATGRTILPDNIRFMWGDLPGPEHRESAALYAINLPGGVHAPLLDASDIAEAQNTSQGQHKEIRIRLNTKGKVRLERATAGHINEAIGIALDNYILLAPTVLNTITGGTLSITGNFTDQETDRLVKMINAGTLPVSFKIKKIEETSSRQAK